MDIANQTSKEKKAGSRATHLNVAQALADRIRRGQLRPLDRMPTFAEIKAEFGVASNTVDRALFALAQNGLIVRKRGSGTYVTARGAKANGARVAFIPHFVISGAGNFSTDYWMGFVAGVQSAAVEQGADLTIPHGINSINWKEFDGVIAFSDYLAEVMRRKPVAMPIVAAGTLVAGALSVSVNDYEAGQVATQHLLDLGHKRIGFMGGLSFAATNLRQAGYRMALWNAGVPYNERLARMMDYAAGDQATGGEMSMDAWIEDGFDALDCTSLIVHNDFYALGVIRSLVRRGYSVPGDVSVIGFDNEQSGEYFSPALTSVSTEMKAVGALATQTLMRLISGETVAPLAMMVPVALIVRDSTVAPQKP